jgi:hypothetical protein
MPTTGTRRDQCPGAQCEAKWRAGVWAEWGELVIFTELLWPEGPVSWPNLAGPVQEPAQHQPGTAGGHLPGRGLTLSPQDAQK